MFPEDHEKYQTIATQTIMHIVVKIFMLHMAYLLGRKILKKINSNSYNV